MEVDESGGKKKAEPKNLPWYVHVEKREMLIKKGTYRNNGYQRLTVSLWLCAGR